MNISLHTIEWVTMDNIRYLEYMNKLFIRDKYAEGTCSMLSNTGMSSISTRDVPLMLRPSNGRNKKQKKKGKGG